MTQNERSAIDGISIEFSFAQEEDLCNTPRESAKSAGMYCFRGVRRYGKNTAWAIGSPVSSGVVYLCA